MSTQRPLSHHIRQLLSLGLPLVGTFVASFLIHATDSLMLGWYDVTALAASTVAGGVFFLLFIFGSGFAHAVTPMVAEAVEQGDQMRTRRVTRMALWLSMVFAAFAMPVFWFSEHVMLLIGQKADVARLSQDYLRIAGWGLFAGLALNVLRSFLSALHLTAVLLLVTLVALVANAALNWVLIFGNLGAPELGIRGAGIASLVVQSLQVLLLAIYAARKRPEFDLFRRVWRADWEALREVNRLGIPIGLTGLAESGLFTCSSIMMGWIGTVELAAHGIALQLTALAFMFHVGMSQAATVRSGGHFGRRDPVALRIGARAAFIVSLSFGVMVIVLFLALPGPLVSLYIDPSDPDSAAVLAIGVTLLMLSALFQFVDATQIVALSLLRGLQDTAIPMWLAAISYWIVGIPVSYLLAFTFDLGAVGLWLGLTVGLGLAALLLGLRLSRMMGRVKATA